MRILLLFLLMMSELRAETIRVGTWNSDFSRKGPGLLIAELLEGSEELDAWGQAIKALELDYFVLVDVDQDYESWSAKLLAELAGFENYAQGPSNRGVPTGFDLNRDGYFDEQDNQGFGGFVGQHGVVILSQSAPLGDQSFNNLLLKDFSEMPKLRDEPFYEPEAWDGLKFSPTGLWDFDFGEFHLLPSYANTPAFDGPEARNVLRNAAEINWWRRYTSGEEFNNDRGEETKLTKPFVLIGTLNLDPERGKGEREAIRELLASPHLRPVEFDDRNTVDWSEQGLGEMRVDYILPSCHFQQTQSGMVDMNSTHKLIWAELERSDQC